jgi:4-hydroxy-2-oxoheptanedioate aldolase
MADRAALKRKLKAGEVVVGPFCIVPSLAMVEAAGQAGMDFLIIDTEHGPIDISTAENMCRAADAVGIAPIVRVGENHPWLILRALDIGSAGVQIPQINDLASAKAAVESAKYAPIGDRGLSIFTRAGDYGLLGARHTSKLNEEQMVIVHIEGTRGVKNLDEILTVDGIDVIFLGPYDLSQSLGIPGQVEDPRVEELMRGAARKAKAAGKVVGSYAKDTAMAKRLISMGVQYLSWQVDATIYMYACREMVQQVKKK